MRRLFAALLMALLMWSPARADDLRPSSIEFVERGEGLWHLGWKQNLGQGSAAVLQVPHYPGNCEALAKPYERRGSLALVGSLELRCQGSLTGQAIGWPGLANEDALLRVVFAAAPTQTYRLTPAQPMATIHSAPTRWQVWQSYFPLGVVHILEGWDHLLFVIALVLLVTGSWAAAKAITAFTIAHSLTLAAVTLGFVGLPARPVEAIIALSIVFLAVELSRGEAESFTRRWPWVVAFAFGLFHGFGFAGALRDIGLPQGEVPSALLSFNLGVEAGQLLVIAAVLSARRIIARIAPKAELPVFRVATYAIGVTASYWLIQRVLV